MRLKRSPYHCPNIRRQPPEVFNGFRSKYDGERHSGQIIARIPSASNGARRSQALIQPRADPREDAIIGLGLNTVVLIDDRHADGDEAREAIEAHAHAG